jgi:hypothetical protein
MRNADFRKATEGIGELKGCVAYAREGNFLARFATLLVSPLGLISVIPQP